MTELDKILYIPQARLKNLHQLLTPGKVIVLYGARQVGKTTLVRRFVDECEGPTLLVSGEDIAVRQFLESQSISKLRDFVGDSRTLVVDEAQHVKQIGLNLKLLVDHLPELNIIATGSSSFELARDTGEPLTGRQITLSMYPLSQLEISFIEPRHETAANLETRLIYGTYPEIVKTADNNRRERYLRELVGSYLFKDILALEGVRHSDKLIRLLQLLAFQIGKDVSLSELGGQVGLSKNTVDRYLDLLQKVFVIYKRRGFARNLRKEISKSHRYYFVDNGIRNTLINNFNLLSMRDDTGALFENYVLTERLKYREYSGEHAESYFWRTYDQKEIDLIESLRGKLFAYEIKWRPQKVRAPKDWLRSYPDAGYQVIHRDNYLDFIK